MGYNVESIGICRDMRKPPKSTPVSLLSSLLAGRARVPHTTLAGLLLGATRLTLHQNDATGSVEVRPCNRARTRYRLENLTFKHAQLGKNLVEKAIEQTKTSSLIAQVDAMDVTILGVLTELGFRHFATIRHYQGPSLQLEGSAQARWATERDANALFDLYCACTPLPIKTIEDPHPRDFASDFKERWLDARQRIVVENGDRIVGSLECRFNGQKWQLFALALPGWEPLIREAVAFAQSHLEGPMEAFVLHYQTALAETFESLGFAACATELRLVRESLLTLRIPQRIARFRHEDPAFHPAFCDR